MDLAIELAAAVLSVVFIVDFIVEWPKRKKRRK